MQRGLYTARSEGTGAEGAASTCCAAVEAQAARRLAGCHTARCPALSCRCCNPQSCQHHAREEAHRAVDLTAQQPLHQLCTVRAQSNLGLSLLAACCSVPPSADTAAVLDTQAPASDRISIPLARPCPNQQVSSSTGAQALSGAAHDRSLHAGPVAEGKQRLWQRYNTRDSPFLELKAPLTPWQAWAAACRAGSCLSDLAGPAPNAGRRPSWCCWPGPSHRASCWG